MSSKIAPSTLETSGTEDLVVSDVYVEQKVEPINKEQPNEVATAAKAVAEDLQKKVKVNDLARMLTIQDGKASVSGSDAKNMVKNVSGGPNSPFEALKGAIGDQLLKSVGFKDDKELARAANGPAGSTVKTKKGYMTISGIKTIYSTYQSISKMDLNSAQGITAMLNSIAGNSQLSKVLDMEAQFKVLGNIVTKLSELGIPEAIDIVLQKLADDKERKRLMIENLRNFIYQSDLVSINKVIDYVGPGGAISRVPDFVNLMLIFYRYPIGASQPTQVMRDALLNTIQRVSPTWYLYSRNGTNVVNLEPYVYASEQARELLMFPTPISSSFASDISTTPVANIHFIPALIGRNHRSIDLIEAASRDFPHVVLQRQNIYVKPRV